MENKLEQLTRKLYDEGLSKGRAQADTLIADAESKAKKIVADAQAEAEKIVADARRNAEESRRNTETEIALAGRQSVTALKESIRDMIVSKSAGEAVKGAMLDAAFVKELLLTIAKNWQGASAAETGLIALLPESKRKEMDAAFGDSTAALLKEGVELRWSDGMKNGFSIGPKEGGYRISFTDADFEALLGEYLRPKVAELLYGKEDNK